MASQPTHYEILDLPKSLLEDASPEQTTQIIKRAYHRALLRHHPDKAVTISSAPPTQKPSSGVSSSNSSSNSNSSTSKTTSTTTTSYTIDQIITAHTILSTPSTKKLYDQSLRTSNVGGMNNNNNDNDATFQTGIETIDLDDLSSTDTADNTQEEESPPPTTFWWKSCRCGNPQGFRFGEADLEEAGELGELIVGCQDCSLWLRVHFAVVVDDEV